MQFSLVSTVFNEGVRLEQTITDLECQILLPSQLIVTDAGSTDGTYERLLLWKKQSPIDIIILQKNRCNVAEGRNLAIEHASHEIIVSTDFGCRFHKNWLKSLILPFAQSQVNVVGGAFTVLEEEIISEAAKANYILTNGYQVVLDESFIPSSRSIAYKKFVWEEVGGYCEWLSLAADDLVFGKAIKAKGFQIFLVHEPYVYWMRHEKAVSYGKEAYRYGLGDGEARVNFKNTMVVLIETSMRYLFIPVLLLALLIAFKISPLILLLPLPFLIGFRPYFNAWKRWQRFRSAKYSSTTFVHALTLIERTRYNYLKGYYKGYVHSTAYQREGAKKLKMILG